jgi:hypothetical protein
MIQPKPSTINEILTLSEHFVVPKYQRGFAWDKDHEKGHQMKWADFASTIVQYGEKR